MEWIYPLDADEMPELAEVGAKGLSLISMTRHGLPVPPGFVLGVQFFQPWLKGILGTEEWQRALHSPPHGALVARECGKPCVAGIENATTVLRDGQAVEIDGSSGMVRLV